jgi:hypothetical protein
MSAQSLLAVPWRAARKALWASALALLCLVASFVSQDQPPQPPPIISQGARALPVLASHGMVVAQEETAAKIGEWTRCCQGREPVPVACNGRPFGRPFGSRP